MVIVFFEKLSQWKTVSIDFGWKLCFYWLGNLQQHVCQWTDTKKGSQGSCLPYRYNCIGADLLGMFLCVLLLKLRFSWRQWISLSLLLLGMAMNLCVHINVNLVLDRNSVCCWTVCFLMPLLVLKCMHESWRLWMKKKKLSRGIGWLSGGVNIVIADSYQTCIKWVATWWNEYG